MVEKKEEESLYKKAIVAYGCIAVWIVLSATVILFNKYLLTSVFKFPITLTLWHMVFCSGLAYMLICTGQVPAMAEMNYDLYVRGIVPVGACFAGTLWLGNAAYLYLSVSFIQMLKALMPVCVFCVGCMFGTEMFSPRIMTNMLVISAGVAYASAGEINFVLIGVIYQLASLASESTRLTLVQILLQRKGLKLNPITTLYYIAPCSAAFLLVPWAFLEAPVFFDGLAAIEFTPKVAMLLFFNALAAFALNLSVFLLIGKTSALTMNVAGVVKDWLLILLSVKLIGDPVSGQSLLGYLGAFVAVCYYNYLKVTEVKAKAAPLKVVDKTEETQALMPTGKSTSQA